LTDDLHESSSFTIAAVDSNIAGKRMGELNTKLFSWDWPGDYELILLIVASIIDTTILRIGKAVMAGLPNTSWKIREHWGRQEDPNGDCCLYTHMVTSIFDNNTAAGWVQVAIK
jgi:hypothetical protein